MKNTKEIGNNNIIEKQKTMHVGASIARLQTPENDLNNKYKQAGITLIALIITIIILLILASITINLTLGERGIFNTAKRAVENYKEAEEREFAELNNFEQETQNTISGLGSGKKDEEEQKPKSVLLNTVTPENYGDYVNYPVDIGRGPEEAAHKSDWRIFYNDGTYVYLISSYYLLNSEVPKNTGISMTGYTGRQYTTYWSSVPSTYTTITDTVRTNYKMSWNENATNPNIKCVSELLDTNKWKKFAYNKANGNAKDYAEDAIGSPTLEMWVESWNSDVENIKLYYNNKNSNGYYIGTSSTATTHYVEGLPTINSLYFPVTLETKSDKNGYTYWISSPSCDNAKYIMLIYYTGVVTYEGWEYYKYEASVRPLVRLKSSVLGYKDANDVWQLE